MTQMPGRECPNNPLKLHLWVTKKLQLLSFLTGLQLQLGQCDPSSTSTENGDRGAFGNGGKGEKKASDAIKEDYFKKTSDSSIKSKKHQPTIFDKEKSIKLEHFFENMSGNKLCEAEEAASTSTSSGI